jgi:predicted nucleic acid-binding protein
MKHGNTHAEIYKKHVQGKLMAVSFITVGELLFGAKKKNWGPLKLADLTQRLRSVVVVPYDREICATYADLKVRVQQMGRPVSDNDLWIAACAVRHQIPLVSNNRDHYSHIPGLVLISEAPVIQQIQSQEDLDLKDLDLKPELSTTSPTEPEPPSSQSPSAAPKKGPLL